ncbi:MAG: rhodanese-like domain-containing protein [Candidatus Thermoplasmatota archaeon]|nr:rhodanese-like domain-containing protein [Candidatus Thermoplasmatota archaeon]
MVITQKRPVEELSPVEVDEIFEESGRESLVILDVREQWEYESDTGHVKGSLLIPMNQVPENMELISSLAGRKIGVICNSGERSYHVCRYLQQNGIENVFNVRGGIIRWLLSGLEVEYGPAGEK